jgi:hypothetical protein
MWAEVRALGCWHARVHERPANQKRQTVMIVTCVASDRNYLEPTTNQYLKRQSAFSGGKHD